MAEFYVADAITRRNEGGWQNDPDDRGNDAQGRGTYCGVASKIHPNWRGWPIVKAAIDGMTQQPHFGTGAYYSWVKTLNKTLAANSTLQSLVDSFYKANFWDVLRLSDFASQETANKIYDSAVNQGTGTAAIILQQVLGVKADGGIGPVTIAAANARDGHELAQAFKVARIARYRKLVKDNPQLAKFESVWVSRC
jgi:lysozyme family protein